MSYAVFSEGDLRARDNRRALVVTLLTLALSASIYLLFKSHTIPPAEATDVRMETACKFPRHEGEFLAVTVHGGRVLCWRYQ